MEDIGIQKAALRKSMLGKRKLFEGAEKLQYDKWVCETLETMIDERECKVIHSYIPFGSEIDITPLLKKLLDKKIKVIAPKALKHRILENRMLDSLSALESGVMGTKHPASPEIYQGPIDFIIVPGLAFDTRNYRLGYGGGYYDNFLAQQPQAFKAGVFYPFQQVHEVPTEPHDLSLDTLIVKSS